jgi:3-deoxy-manno-octulosonate cytidylyltransferase (CMP-KDO synthetase)
MGKQSKVTAIIPARYGSTRLPAKLLLDLQGKPIIQHVYERTSKAQLIDEVLIATDDERIETLVKSFNGNVVMTSSSHETGTDRIAEVAEKLTSEIIVNVQGDEPLIDPVVIDQAICPLLEDSKLMMSTTCETINNLADIFNPNIVKVVLNHDSDALYFSRAPIPFPRFAALAEQRFETEKMLEKMQAHKDLADYYKHTGLYVYRREFLLEFTKWSRSSLEKCESLEQLRVLEKGHKIRVIKTTSKSIGIDTLEDLERARKALNSVSQ